jgi:photosystem II stability/assembly factor-like uncharacterized protein
MQRSGGLGNRASLFGLLAAVLAYCLTIGAAFLGVEGAEPVVDVDLFASAVTPAGRFLMVGDRGKIFLSENGAGSCKRVASGTTNALASACFPEGQHGWVVGQGGVILHSGDGGKTWEAQPSGVEAYLLDVDFLDAARGFAVGEDSTALVTQDGGRTWRNVSLGLSLDLDEEINLFAVAVTAPFRACVAGDRGRIFTTRDGGATWKESDSPLYDQATMEGRILYAMAYDSGVLYAVGIDGAFVRSPDEGDTWMEGTTGYPGPELYCIDIVGGVGFAAGSGGHIVRTTDGGETWSRVEVPEGIRRFWLCGIDLHEGKSGGIQALIAGQEGTFGRLEDGDWRW